MGVLFYIIAAIFVAAWALGVFVYGKEGLIHTLLILAILAVLFRFIQKGKKLI